MIAAIDAGKGADALKLLEQGLTGDDGDAGKDGGGDK
jgi:hypothetical protein